jgi:hypothetical protein
MAQRGIQPRNTVRYMWYGAEELGLLGSRAYVASLSAAWLARIKAMLNFDMVGSPNFVRFVYDGDNSAFPPGGPGGVHDGRGGRDLWRHRRAGVGPVLPLGLRQPVQSQPERLRPDVRCGGTRHAHPGQAEPRQEPARRPAGRGGCRRHRCRGRSSHQRRADQVARSNAEWGSADLAGPHRFVGKEAVPPPRALREIGWCRAAGGVSLGPSEGTPPDGAFRQCPAPTTTKTIREVPAHLLNPLSTPRMLA